MLKSRARRTGVPVRKRDGTAKTDKELRRDILRRQRPLTGGAEGSPIPRSLTHRFPTQNPDSPVRVFIDFHGRTKCTRDTLACAILPPKMKVNTFGRVGMRVQGFRSYAGSIRDGMCDASKDTWNEIKLALARRNECINTYDGRRDCGVPDMVFSLTTDDEDDGAETLGVWVCTDWGNDRAGFEFFAAVFGEPGGETTLGSVLLNLDKHYPATHFDIVVSSCQSNDYGEDDAELRGALGEMLSRLRKEPPPRSRRGSPVSIFARWLKKTMAKKN